MMQSPFNDETERSQQFAANLGASWPNHFPPNNQAINREILKPVIPLLVESFAELMKAVQKENQSIDEHAAVQAVNPSMMPLARIQPLHFVASYLMQHHPKHQTQTQSNDQSDDPSISDDDSNQSANSTNPQYDAYKDALHEAVDAQSPEQ